MSISKVKHGGFMNELALFAGAGGGILGGKLLGWRTVCAVEWQPFCIGVLSQRQNDKILPAFPIWDDVCTFDGRPWRGLVDVVSGGFPCQDLSTAGKGRGLDGERSGLWREMARVVDEVRPRFVFVENSPALLVRGFERVLGDLATMGFDARWGVLSGRHVGAPHARERLWVVAHANERALLPEPDSRKHLTANTPRCGFAGNDHDGGNARRDTAKLTVPAAWKLEPTLDRVADGVVHRVDRLAAIGNGQIPAVAAAAWRILTHNDRIQPRR